MPHISFNCARKLTPTPLDRRRMEQIDAQSAQIQKLQEAMGRQLLVLRGRGGAGKTTRLLQLAKALCEEEGTRVLILTYNKALASDLRPQLAAVVDEGDHAAVGGHEANQPHDLVGLAPFPQLLVVHA